MGPKFSVEMSSKTKIFYIWSKNKQKSEILTFGRKLPKNPKNKIFCQIFAPPKNDHIIWEIIFLSYFSIELDQMAIKIEFYAKNCVYSQLEMSGNSKFGQKMRKTRFQTIFV